MDKKFAFTCKVCKKFTKFKNKTCKEPNLLVLGENDFKEFIEICDVANSIDKEAILSNETMHVVFYNDIKVVRTKQKNEFKFAFALEIEEEINEAKRKR